MVTAAMRVVDMSDFNSIIDKIEAKYPAWIINALGKIDMDNIRTLLSMVKEQHTKIERLETKISTLEKQVSDAGWEADARREQDEIARAREWR